MKIKSKRKAKMKLIKKDLLIFILSSLTVLGAGTLVTSKLKRDYDLKRYYDNLRKYAVEDGDKNTVIDTEGMEKFSSELLDSGYEFKNIKWDYLRAYCYHDHGINDMIGWITIDGTNVDYPISQSQNNAYYLKHDFSRTDSEMGGIYQDFRNEKLCEKEGDLNSISWVYGHNWYTGEMFANLISYRYQDFYDEHKQLIIYRPDCFAYLGEIFASEIIDSSDTNYYRLNDFATIEENQKYLDMLYENSYIKTDVEVNPGDKIIALATCIYKIDGIDDARIVVYAKLTPIVITESQKEEMAKQGRLINKLGR